MERKYDILVLLDPYIDLVVDLGGILPEFNQKEKFINDYQLELGGSCGIFASQASKLRLKTAAVGTVGSDDFGWMIKSKLRDNGVDITWVDTDSTLKSGLGVLLSNGGDRSILTYPGTVDQLQVELISDEFLAQFRHLHIGSYYLMETLRKSCQDIVQRAKQNGLTISLDTNWDPSESWNGGIWDVLPYVDIFLPNQNELLGITHNDDLDAAIDSVSKVVRCLVVKRGADGALLHCAGERWVATSLAVDVRDTVGAGDCFDAGFIYGLLNNYTPQQALQLAVACGSFSTTRHGGIQGQLDANDVKQHAVNVNVYPVKEEL